MSDEIVRREFTHEGKRVLEIIRLVKEDENVFCRLIWVRVPMESMRIQDGNNPMCHAKYPMQSNYTDGRKTEEKARLEVMAKFDEYWKTM